jgi:hypothetical protein
LTSDSKTKANRENAQASAGPKTAHGRVRAAGNARRRGLSLPIYSNPILSKEVEALAHEIAGIDANAEIRQLARRIAEAQIELRRVRHAGHARRQFLSVNNMYNDAQPNMRDKEAAARQCVRPRKRQVVCCRNTFPIKDRFGKTKPNSRKISKDPDRAWRLRGNAIGTHCISHDTTRHVRRSSWWEKLRPRLQAISPVANRAGPRFTLGDWNRQRAI